MQVSSCDRCQRNNKKFHASAGVLHPIPVQVGMDLIGPLPETSLGNKYIITLTDYFSKWAKATALPDKTAAKFMYRQDKINCYA